MNKQRVMEYIKANFDLSYFTISEWPLLPGGTLLTDQSGGTILVWTDISTNDICYSINGESAKSQS